MSKGPRTFRSERAFKKAIVDDLHSRGLPAWSAGAGPWQRAGVLDITTICYDGVRLDIEAKMPGERPTMLQEKMIAHLQQCNGEAFWTDTWEGYIATIVAILTRHPWHPRRF